MPFSFSFHAKDLSPEERRRQVAAILARDVLRRQRLLRTSGPRPAGKSLESGPTGLEVPGETRLSVSRRIGF